MADKHDKQKVITETIKYIEAHLDDKLKLDEIADHIGYSKFHLSRIFADEVGITMHKYVQKRRLTEAAKKLVESDHSITEIAFDANYESQQAFTLAFRQLYLCTPQIYRNQKDYMPIQERYITKGKMHGIMGSSHMAYNYLFDRQRGGRAA